MTSSQVVTGMPVVCGGKGNELGADSLCEITEKFVKYSHSQLTAGSPCGGEFLVDDDLVPLDVDISTR